MGTTTNEELNTTADWWLVVLTVIFVGGLSFVGALLTKLQPSFELVENVGIFAGFYIMAQAIERLLEPFTHLFHAKDTAKKESDEAQQESDKAEQTLQEKMIVYHRVLSEKGENTNESIEALEEAKRAETEKDQKALIKKKKEAKKKRVAANTAVLLWGIASVVAMLISGYLDLLFLKTVGFKDVPTFIDILITGMVIGAGTKPLHDLISYIEKRKDQSNETGEESS